MAEGLYNNGGRESGNKKGATLRLRLMFGERCALLAANALRRPSASAEAVSADVGYQSVAAFRRVFTRWAGMTPGEWRRQSFGGPRDAAASDDGVAGDAE